MASVQMIFSFQTEEMLSCFAYYNAFATVFDPGPLGSGSLTSTDAALMNSEVASLFSREKDERSSVRRAKILLLEI